MGNPKKEGHLIDVLGAFVLCECSLWKNVCYESESRAKWVK